LIPDISQIITIAEKAGEAVMVIYSQRDFTESYKVDSSPVTLADITSEKIIVELLRKLAPELPILSEESKMASYEERKSWENYWLVDPLDGTKEFIKRSGEFTVNIALI
jgi:3'(2'), 5'-bisphosphate nucleotidase